MKNSIPISPNHGVNPSLGLCPICGKENGEVLLLGRLKNDAEAPRFTLTMHPCNDCQSLLDAGNVGLVEIDDTGQTTGISAIITKSAYARNFTTDLGDRKLAFIESPILRYMLEDSKKEGAGS